MIPAMAFFRIDIPVHDPDSQYYNHIMRGEFDFSVKRIRKEDPCSTAFQ
jgi:hypothetical protein